MTLKTKLLSTAAIVTVALGPVFGAAYAQDAAVTTETEVSASAGTSAWNEELDARFNAIADVRIAELLGMNVISDTGNDVGEIDNFVILDNTLKAVIGVGGFLGLGEHSVAIPLEDFEYDGTHMIVSLTEDELRALPEWHEELEQERYAENDTLRMRSAGEEIEQDVAEAAEATENAAEEAGQELAEAGEATENAVENAAAETEQMAENAAQATENAAEEAGQELAEAGQATENALENAAAETEQMAENAAQATENAAEEAGQELAEAGQATENALENAAAETEQMAENAAQATSAAAGAAAATVAGWVEKLENEFAEIADWRATEIEGTDVINAAGENIGEVEGLAEQDGTLVALVGIGGFLGLGEHDVAVEFDRLGWNGEAFVLDGVSEEELKEMPEADTATLTMIEDDVTLRERAAM